MTMPKHPRKPPRLYLDPKRGMWVVRYGTWFKRTPFSEQQRSLAEEYLAKALHRGSWNKSPSAFRPGVVRLEVIGLIYFISKRGCAEYPIKIGFSASQFKRRLVDIQIGNPEPLEVLTRHPAYYADEQRLHAVLWEDCKLGEWFFRTEKVLAALAAARTGKLLEWTMGHSTWPQLVPAIKKTNDYLTVGSPADTQATKPPTEG